MSSGGWSLDIKRDIFVFVGGGRGGFSGGLKPSAHYDDEVLFLNVG